MSPIAQISRTAVSAYARQPPGQKRIDRQQHKRNWAVGRSRGGRVVDAPGSARDQHDTAPLGMAIGGQNNGQGIAPRPERAQEGPDRAKLTWGRRSTEKASAVQASRRQVRAVGAIVGWLGSGLDEVWMLWVANCANAGLRTVARRSSSRPGLRNPRGPQEPRT